MRRALAHRHERVGHRAGGVVMAVHPDPESRELAEDVPDDTQDVIRQRPAVRVTQRQRVRTRLSGRGKAGERIAPVGRVAVEEVLSIEYGPPPLAHEEPHRVGHHSQVLLARGPQRLVHVQRPRLADQRHDRRLRHEQRLQVRIAVGGPVRPPRRPERSQLRVPPRQLAGPCEELLVLRVRPRPPALDDINPERVKRRGDSQFVLDGEVESDLLGTVAEGRVIHFHAGGRSGSRSGTAGWLRNVWQRRTAVRPAAVMCGHRDTSAVRASAQASVDAAPPAASTASTAASSSAAASGSPRWSSMRGAESTAPAGFALPVPAMSGAEPWTGSNMEGPVLSGLRLPLADRPRPPVRAAARSVRMSPNRLSVTITSNLPESLTMYRQAASTWV